MEFEGHQFLSISSHCLESYLGVRITDKSAGFGLISLYSSGTINISVLSHFCEYVSRQNLSIAPVSDLTILRSLR